MSDLTDQDVLGWRRATRAWPFPAAGLRLVANSMLATLVQAISSRTATTVIRTVNGARR